MSEIVEAVAKAITRAIDQSERVQLLSRDEMMQKAARAAIQAYEAHLQSVGEAAVKLVEKEINYSPDWVGETSIHTGLDGTRYEATWLESGKVGGPKLKIERLP